MLNQLKAGVLKNYNLIIKLSIIVLVVTAIFTFFLAWQNLVVAFDRQVFDSDIKSYKNAGLFVLQGKDIFSDEYTYLTGTTMAWMMPPFAAVLFVPLAFVPDEMLYPVWDSLQLVALFTIVWFSASRFISKMNATKKVLTVIGFTFIALAFSANQDSFTVGQSNIILAAIVIIDIMLVRVKKPKLQGFLVGVAAGIKILPGIFILYFLITKQWRAASNAVIGFVVTIVLGAVILWDNTMFFWRDLAFLKPDGRNGGFAITYFNQSLRGVIDRASGSDTPQMSILWLLLAGITLIVGMLIAAKLYKAGEHLAAVSIVGLVLLLCAPTSWIHYGIWVVPAVGVILGSGTNKARNILAVAVSIPLMQQIIGRTLPYLPALTYNWWVFMYIILIVCIVYINKNVLKSKCKTSVL